MSVAFGFGPANILSPFQYFQLLASVMVGYLAFAEVPGAQAFWWIDRGLGCALVGDLPRDTLRRLALQAYHDLTEG